ncbi:hypothetical protein HU200_017674 [Digitaria exilis]|uniref:Uncharacterized protein n=1 Tax=Digitaria exilis TaxID=1010633 RepID=A0A835F6D2_9POAL|nr:hypothetical protein HU200_017674 [Digitaria exilis]
MASLPDPTVYYPTSSSSSNAILRAHPSNAAASRGSFGPVFAVLAVISVLAVAACVVGRLCGRRLSRKKATADDDYYGSDAVGGDQEKGFEIKYPAMKPMASSRAMIHDIDDGFEIKFAPGKPAAWKSDTKADNKGRQQQQHLQGHHQHQPQQQHQPQLVGMMPKGYVVPKEYAGFRYPADAVVRQGQIRGGAFIPAKPST